jgi:hypothetical protein
MFISATGSASLPPRTRKPRTPSEKSPVRPFELPPRKPVTNMPSPTAAISAAGSTSPAFQSRLDAFPEVGAVPSFRP